MQDLQKKLQLKPGQALRVVNKPAGVALDLPRDEKSDAVLLFVGSVAELEKLAPPVLKRLPDDALFWVAYPKKTGAIKTDLNRDHGWGALSAAGLEGVRLISLDETWSVMRFRPKKKARAEARA